MSHCSTTLKYTFFEIAVPIKNKVLSYLLNVMGMEKKK